MPRFSKERWQLVIALVVTAAFGMVAVAPSPPLTAYAAPAAQTQPFAWSIGGPGPDEGRSVGVDGAGNVYLAGVFTGTIDLDPGPETFNVASAGGTDIFLAKYDPTGRLVWGWGMGGGGADRVQQIVVDVAGSVSLAGSFSGEVDFEPGEGTAIARASGERNGFVARYDTDGALKWVSPLAVPGDEDVLALALDRVGNVVAAGLAELRIVAPAGSASVFDIVHGDVFALRLDGEGRITWSIVLPSASEGPHPVGLALDPAGNLYLATSYTGTLRVNLKENSIDATSLGGTDVALLKLDPNGGLIWSRSFGGLENDYLGQGGLTVDHDGNAVLTGSFDGTVDVNGDASVLLESSGQGDLFLVSYTPSGLLRWAGSLGGPGRDGGQRVLTDAARYVYVAGWLTGTPRGAAPLDGRPIVGRGQAGGADALLAKYTPDGRLAWGRAFGGTASGPARASLASGVIVAPGGDVLLTGRLFGTDVNVDPAGGVAILSSLGESDVFLISYGPDGAPRRR